MPMNLSLDADQTMLRDEARRLLAERASPAARRALIARGEARDTALWHSLARDLGWCGVAVPEAHGGLGLGFTEVALLLEEAGRHLAPVPLFSTIALAAPLLGALGEGAHLPRIASGEVTPAVALPETTGAGTAQPGITTGAGTAQPGIRAEPAGDGWHLSGTALRVIDLPGADLVLVVAETAGALALFALTGAAEAAALDGLDPTRPLGRLTCERTPAERLGEPFDAARLDRALAPARLGLAAEQIGAAAGAFEMTLAYLAGRVQFGRTIASFQAIKHRCAALAVDLAEARSLLYGAAQSLARPDADTAAEIAALSLLARELCFRAAEEAIQLHGGVGFTTDYDPHLYLRRAQATAFALGVPDEQERIARHVLGDAA
jgi:acyl-CoA dehydrogenase